MDVRIDAGFVARHFGEILWRRAKHRTFHNRKDVASRNLDDAGWVEAKVKRRGLNPQRELPKCSVRSLKQFG